MSDIFKYNCVFGGGGIRGLTYVGAVRALSEFGIELDSIAGSSVGSVFASFYAAGYNADEIKDLFFEFNLNMFRDINFSLFPSDLSLSKGEIFYNWLKEKIGKKFYGENYSKDSVVTFKDLRKDLYILTIDLNTNSPFVFSKKTTPDAEIAFAVRASASLPTLMKPVPFENMLLVDGDLAKSLSSDKIYQEFNDSDLRILEFRLEGSRNGTNIKNPLDYINSVISTISFLSTENVYEKYSQNDKTDIIVIDTKDVILFDFNVGNDVKNELINLGYNLTKKYFSETIIKKKTVIINRYEKINNKLKVLDRYVSFKSPDKGLDQINSILADIKDDLKYIDKKIYMDIKLLKNHIEENIEGRFLFGKKLANISAIKGEILNIKKFVDIKINENLSYVTNYSEN